MDTISQNPEAGGYKDCLFRLEKSTIAALDAACRRTGIRDCTTIVRLLLKQALSGGGDLSLRIHSKGEPHDAA